MKTKVLFRMFKGEVLALFPADAWNVGEPWNCSSYAHVGQHSGANCLGVIQDSRPAKPAEYRELAAELRRIGYQLQIVKRARPRLQAAVAKLRHSMDDGSAMPD